MADSYITKRALAASLRALMQEQPFDKINVAQICAGCNMSRKSFYYHFKDKYDLVNWIFDSEFIALVKDADPNVSYQEHWALIEKSCAYFYANRSFYRKALQIQGQNSFTDHFREYIRPLLLNRLTHLYGAGEVDEFAVAFFTDAVLCAMERWLLTKDCMPPEVFIAKVRQLMEKGAQTLCTELAGADPAGQAKP